MSGDVQPKKRKDKRKRKEDHQEEVVQQPAPPVTPIINVDDTNIHVHKEKSIGGGICAKCVFFIISLAIAIILGLTIVEHRGLTDIDIPLSESRFASIFEGWIDTEKLNHGDHGEENFDHDAVESHEDEEEDEGIRSEEEEEEQEGSEEVQQEYEQEESEEVEEDEREESEQDQEDSEQYQEESDQEQEEEEEEEDEDEEVEPESPEIQAESEEEEQPEESEEERQADESDEEIHEEPEESEEQQPQESEEEQKDVSEEEPQQSEEDQKDPSEEADEKDEDEHEDQENAGNVQNSANTGVAAKIFVGAALLVVAYVVLIKKWRSERIEKPAKKDEKDETPNLSRRNTIVPPPTLEEIEQDLENLEEYSEDEEEESEEEIRIPATKKQYEELRVSYTRTFTPKDNEQEEYDDNEEEVEEEEYENRDEEEYEEEEDDDDEELMKKLEEKYGRLDAKTKYEAEEEEEEEEQDEEIDEEEEEEEDIEDDGSWKRVKLSDDQESESDDEKPPKKRSGAQAYEFENITNNEDFLIRETLDYAQQHLPNNLALALNLFIKILENFPESPRALYGRALTLDHLAEKKRSNEILQESIKYFAKALNAKNVPDALFLATATRCIERMRFIGNYAKAVDIHQKLITRFPDEIKYRNDFAVTLLTINRIPQARSLLLETLRKWPDNGFALVHYGFVLKTVDNNLPLAIEYLTKGINTKESGVVDGRFYFHLGDALARIGKPEEAIKTYEDGVNQKVFLSKYQRSLYNVDRLTGRPWWTLEESSYMKLYQLLQQNWKEIRKEGLAVLDKKGYFKDESENLKDVGDWKQFELYARGIKNKENCLKCPITCQIIDSSPEARSCRRGQVKFSVMHPGTHVWPHCGPTNCRLRVHLGLKVPPKTYIRVAEETRSWEEGKIIVFDDSFEHEVWHNGTEYRLVLIVDVWHPELTKSERINLSPI